MLPTGAEIAGVLKFLGKVDFSKHKALLLEAVDAALHGRPTFLIFASRQR